MLEAHESLIYWLRQVDSGKSKLGVKLAHILANEAVAALILEGTSRGARNLLSGVVRNCAVLAAVGTSDKLQLERAQEAVTHLAAWVLRGERPEWLKPEAFELRR